jgi:RNA polymerase sigma-70 factor, ECF subfamily
MMAAVSATTGAISAEEFEGLRPFLFGMAYRMTGSAADAEDLVQEAWLRGLRNDAPLEHPKAFFATVITRLAMDHLRSARVQREEYPGEWLPEPLVTPAGTDLDPARISGARETLSYAMLTLLEQLSPVERAVFVLHEAFDYRHGEIARMLEIEEAASRQHLRRARQHLQEKRPRFGSSREVHQQLLQRFLAAASLGDMAGLTSLLTANAVSVSDGGGKVRAAMNIVRGAESVAKLIAGIVRKNPIERTDFVEVNGQPGLVSYHRDRIDNVLVLDITEDGLVAGVYLVRNPDKLPAGV